MNRPRLLIFVVVLASCGAISAQLIGRRFLFGVLKVLTTLSILAIALLNARHSPGYRAGVLLGLGLGLLGDVLLLDQGDMSFVRGLIAFMIAHIVYAATFSQGVPTRSALWVAMPLACVIASVSWYLWPCLGTMRWPVVVYELAIAVMLWRAVARWAHFGSAGAGLAAIGAALFFCSDAALAMNRFRHPSHWSPIWILGTYWFGQTMIALSF